MNNNHGKRNLYQTDDFSSSLSGAKMLDFCVSMVHPLPSISSIIAYTYAHILYIVYGDDQYIHIYVLYYTYHVEAKHDVEFTYVAKPTIHGFDKTVNKLQDC
jgi:hypothetical protein